ncbi:hypothetical protein CRE_06959 [Caenorhabditis remanei]|uniref:Retrotransposon gag domain-containing protein n=1 Tax=Caenorhabditis remanei TaxID=31234 RepID=E3N6M4_CAERE|nr:hypothetical protein CRE_06959 [Caenorhabditis remanei]
MLNLNDLIFDVTMLQNSRRAQQWPIFDHTKESFASFIRALQQVNLPVHSYAKKIEELINCAYSGNEDVRNAIRLSSFLSGLRPEKRKEIRNPTLENFEETVRAARNMENTQSLESAEQGNIVAAVQQLTETFRHWN